MRATRTKAADATNDHMTRQCGHGNQDMCDYCLIAFGDHAEKPGVKGHVMQEDHGQGKYTCAQCPKSGEDTIASRQEARADSVAERITARLFEGRKGHGQSPAIVERHMRRFQIKHVVKLAYELGVTDGMRDGRAG